jgi:hypothetical protein
MSLYTISFKICSYYKYKTRFYNSLPLLIKNTFEFCKNQENCIYYVNALFNAILRHLNNYDFRNEFSIKELLIDYQN